MSCFSLSLKESETLRANIPQASWEIRGTHYTTYLGEDLCVRILVALPTTS